MSADPAVTVEVTTMKVTAFGVTGLLERTDTNSQGGQLATPRWAARVYYKSTTYGGSYTYHVTSTRTRNVSEKAVDSYTSREEAERAIGPACQIVARMMRLDQERDAAEHELGELWRNGVPS